MLPNKFNGYDVSYLTVKYLMDTQSKNDFNKLIRDNTKVKNMEKIFGKMLLSIFLLTIN